MKVFAIAAGAALLTGAAAQEVTLQHGQWEITTQFTDVQAPGMPEEAVAQIRAQLAQGQTQSDCMTPQEAADPVAALGTPATVEGCDFSRSAFAGGEIALRGICPGPSGPASMRMTFEGSYTATTMQATVTTEMDLPTDMSGTTTRIRLLGTFEGRRVGACGG